MCECWRICWSDRFWSDATTRCSRSLQTRSRRYGQNESRWPSTEARDAKRLHRRLELGYRRTRLDIDKKAFLNARTAARDSIMKSRAEDIRKKLAEVDGGARATWRTAQKLLHSKPPVYQNDAKCARFSSVFSQFFVDKINRLRHSITVINAAVVFRWFSFRNAELSRQ